MPTATSISPRTPLSCHDHGDPAASPAAQSRGGRVRSLALDLVAAAVTVFTSLPSTASGDPLAALRCTLAVETPAGGGPQLRATLHNTGTHTVRLLRWGTPFEGAWRAPIVQIERNGQPLDYQGPVVKRRTPQARDHLTLGPGQSLQALLPLSPVWATDLPGHYRLSANWMWHGQMRDGQRTITPLLPTDARCEPVQFMRP